MSEIGQTACLPECMLPPIGTRFPESPIPSRVLIAIGPGAPPRGQLHKSSIFLVVITPKTLGRDVGRNVFSPFVPVGFWPVPFEILKIQCAKASPSVGGVPARLAAGIVKCAQAHRSAGRGAIRVAP